MSPKAFITSQIMILILGFAAIGGFHYILNIQYQPPTGVYSATGGPVTSAPATLVLELQQPEDDLLVFQPSVIISGKTAPKSSIYISSESNDQALESKKDGTFSTVFDLKGGTNNIQILVFDKTGDSKSLERLVYYSKEKI